MKNRKTIYCECQFIKFLPQEQLNDFYRFSNESVIVLDITFAEFSQECTTNAIFKFILKRQQSGGCELKFDFKTEKFIEDCRQGTINPFSPIILIYQSRKQRLNENKCGTLYNEFGLLVADQSDFIEKCNLMQDYGFAIKKDDQSSWKQLLKNAPCYSNSLLIVDNYLLSDSNKFEMNLLPILDCILPEKLKTIYNISFFTQDRNSTLASRESKIKNIISTIRPKLKFSVNLFIDERNIFHDRVIISNYFWIQCGAGFDLFGINSKAGHSTTLSFLYPFIQGHVPWAKDAFCNLLEDAKNIADTAICNGSIRQFYGEGKGNVLFKMK